jgi:hypothetical protein
VHDDPGAEWAHLPPFPYACGQLARTFKRSRSDDAPALRGIFGARSVFRGRFQRLEEEAANAEEAADDDGGVLGGEGLWERHVELQPALPALHSYQDQQYTEPHAL